MSADVGLLLISLAILGVATVSGRIERSVLTVPILIVALGLIGGFIFDVDVAMDRGPALIFLEITLTLVLFADASRIDLNRLRRQYRWPQRMLLIGLPLAIIFGSAASAWVLGLPLGLAVVLGVCLAPTDAALAEPVLTTEVVPKRIRQTINIESGLNDGLALPALAVGIALVEAEVDRRVGEFILVAMQEIGIGLLGGLVFGLVGAWLIGTGVTRGWIRPGFQRLGTVALALAAFGATQALGGSGFVAAFLAGMIFAARCRKLGVDLFEFAHHESSLLVMLAFLLFGLDPLTKLAANPPGLEVWVVALLSLLLVRPVSILISLVGVRLALPTKLFFGWFGPRGLASIVFVITAAAELGSELPMVFEVVTLTVGLSVLLHGITAYPASMALARSLARREEEDMPEMVQVEEMPTRMIT